MKASRSDGLPDELARTLAVVSQWVGELSLELESGTASLADLDAIAGELELLSYWLGELRRVQLKLRRVAEARQHPSQLVVA